MPSQERDLDSFQRADYDWRTWIAKWRTQDQLSGVFKAGHRV
jgi:hypothetical protein